MVVSPSSDDLEYQECGHGCVEASALIVGQTPWSAADGLVGLFAVG
jgi:hypothetical protein